VGWPTQRTTQLSHSSIVDNLKSWRSYIPPNQTLIPSGKERKSYLRFHWAKSDPLEFINLLLLVVFLGNPRRARSPRRFRVVDFLRKVCESLKVTLKPTTSYWAPTSLKRLKEKKASFRSVWGSFVVTHTSSATTSFLEGSEHWYTCVSLAPVISI
jgi:hypothetical protein